MKKKEEGVRREWRRKWKRGEGGDGKDVEREKRRDKGGGEKWEGGVRLLISGNSLLHGNLL